KTLKRFEDEVKRARQVGGNVGAKKAEAELAFVQRLQQHLSAGKPARQLAVSDDDERAILHSLNLLTAKPVLYVANVSESQLQTADDALAEFQKKYAPVLPISVKIEQELIELPDEERATFLAEYGLHETGLHRLIRASYQLLNLITFLTTGPDETRAWTVTKGSTAPQAAGKIHSDFEHGFIRAETVAYDDLLAAGGYAGARAAGTVRDEGKEYIVQDGD